MTILINANNMNNSNNNNSQNCNYDYNNSNTNNNNHNKVGVVAGVVARASVWVQGFGSSLVFHLTLYRFGGALCLPTCSSLGFRVQALPRQTLRASTCTVRLIAL